jgi:hypothetical protein
MLLNQTIWKQTVSDAKTKSAGNAALLRAIDRAVNEIERSIYWAFADGVLKIKSTTSRKLYVVDDGHTCEAQSKTCKHHIARRLMLRYTQTLSISVAKVETKHVQNWQRGKGVEIVETKRASMLDEARKATLVKRTVRGEMCNGVDV